LLAATGSDAAEDQSATVGQGDGSGSFEVEIDAIRPNPYQPRRHFDAEDLEDLASSIREHGLIQPLLVTTAGPNADEAYVLIAGERRWRAARIAGLERVPVIVREAEPSQMLALAIIENVQRSDLDAVEAAEGYHRLMEEFGLTQADVGRMVGKTRTAIANTVRLLGLTPDVLALLSRGHLTEGHARALLGIGEPDAQLAMAKQVIEGGWSVRRVEAAVRSANDEATGRGQSRGSYAGEVAVTDEGGPDRGPDTRAAERDLEEVLGTPVRIIRRGQGGRLELHFYSEEELDALYRRLLQPS